MSDNGFKSFEDYRRKLLKEVTGEEPEEDITPQSFEEKPKFYTLEQIKKAFWDTFHESGEIYFEYSTDDKRNNESTEEGWEDFLENLKND